jgi:tetratricopeptide (TPR) repeat protein
MDNLSVADIQIIEKRLENQLSEPELQSFNERLHADADFKEGFVSCQDALKAIHIAGEDDVMAILKEEQAKLELKYDQDASQPLRSVRNPKILSLPFGGWWLAAASVALLCIAGYWFIFSNKELDTDKLYAATFKTKDNTFIIFARDNAFIEQQKQLVVNKYGVEEGTKIFNAMFSYNDGNFDKAVALFNTIPLQNDTLHVYQANALLNINKTQEAITILEKIPSNSPSHDDASWYLALAYLKTKNVEKTKAILTALSKEGNKGYQVKAKNLLEQL